MANNKVQLGDGTVLIDLTADTVTAATLSYGKTAHDKSGEVVTGTAMVCCFNETCLFQYPETVIIPNTVTDTNGGGTSVNGAGFGSHTEIKHIIFQEGCNLSTVKNNTFSHCSGLLEIELPNSVTSIGELAFLDCSSLTEFVLPAAVRSLGGRVWSNCTGLKRFVFNSIPSCSYYTSSGTTNLFYNCPLLEDVQLPDGWNQNIRFLTNVLTHDSMAAMIAALYDYSGGTAHTLTLGSTNLARLSDDEKAVAAAKNWTLA